jgi:hypothetical protein
VFLGNKIDMVQIHQRKSIRLKEYDYSQPGDYFVTIYTQGHKHTFAAIAGYEMQLNKIGNIVKECWERTPSHFKYKFTIFINEMQSTPGKKGRQRSYYDRIIRNEKELNNSREYIDNNVLTTAFAEENPEKVSLFL